MTPTTTSHHPIVTHWPRTATTPEEVFVQCTCGRFEFTSQESISGGIEPWQTEHDQHIEDMEEDQ